MMTTMSARDAVLNVARGLSWVHETNGPNRGEVVDAMIRACGLTPPQPWCMAYVNTVGRMALADWWPLPMSAGCQYVAEAAAHLDLIQPTPMPGAIFLLYGAALGRFRHTGFLIEPTRTPGEWLTIEGNTSPDGSPEGTGVFARRRTFAAHDAFIHWWL